jgi:hypothetical protein
VIANCVAQRRKRSPDFVRWIEDLHLIVLVGTIVAACHALKDIVDDVFC